MQENIKLLIELQGIDSVIFRDKNFIDSMPSSCFLLFRPLKRSISLMRGKQKVTLLEKKKKTRKKRPRISMKG